MNLNMSKRGVFMKFDKFTIGQAFETKSFKLTKEDIIKFAGEFDPLYMHLNEEKAMQSRFKGIIASGIHTIAITTKLWVETGIYGDDVIAGSGMKNIQFIKPVYPGDELYTIVKVVDKEAKKEEFGKITLLFSTYNHKEEKVFEGDLSVLIKR